MGPVCVPVGRPGITKLMAEADSGDKSERCRHSMGLGGGDRRAGHRADGASGRSRSALTARVPEGIVFLPGFSATSPVTGCWDGKDPVRHAVV